nr:immunoglobulin heavy chain junction region [Mus musculus]
CARGGYWALFAMDYW